MLHRVFALGLLTALVFLLPAFAADDTKAKKNDPSLMEPIDSDKLSPGDYTGTLLTTPGSDNTFTLQIDTTHYVPKNPAALSAKEAKLQGQIQSEQLKIMNLQAQLVASTSQKQYNQHLNQLNQANAQLQKLMTQSQIKPSDLKAVTDSRVFNMKLTETADIRYMNLPDAFDDEGKPKVYTAAEKKELKGKKANLPGYEGTLDNLKVGQTVKVTQIHVYAKKDDAKKDDPKADDAKKDDAKKDDVKKDDAKDAKDPTDKPPPEKKMQVKMIVILQDPPDPPDTKDKKKKKNN